MRLDLHVHSTASDGSLPPDAVVREAARGRLDVVALADHDTTAGIASAVEAARPLAIQVVPALEISSTQAGREIHVLGYFVDPEHPELMEYAARAASVREDRIQGMIERLRLNGVHVGFADVVRMAGPERASLGRPHLARAMVEAGYAASVNDAFDRFIGDGHPAFIPTRLLSPAEAIGLVLRAGGVPVWAHPPLDLVDRLLGELVGAGLRGLEVYRPRTAPNQILRLERAARAAGLVASGGSDWHGPDGGAQLGDFHITAEEVAPLLEAGGI